MANKQEYTNTRTGITTRLNQEIDSKVQADFLKELGELSTKYKIIIGGCGCCGSPYLVAISNTTDIVYVPGKEVDGISDIEAITK